MSEKTCSICRRPYTGYGNNAEPVNQGRCCDECNATVVIPARIEQYMRDWDERPRSPEATARIQARREALIRSWCNV